MGARNASHVGDHAAVFSVKLDAEDRAAIDDAVEQGGGRRPTTDCYSWERGGDWA